MEESSSLTADRSLIDINFEGYKLTGNPLDYAALELDCPPLTATFDAASHFSFQYIAAFSLHNHLVQDPWRDDCVYSVDADMYICSSSAKVRGSKRTHDVEEGGEPHEGDAHRAVELWMQRVFSMLAAPDRSGDVVNASLVCASAELCLASDGCGTLYLLRRSEAHEPWSALLTTREVMDGMPYTVTAAAVCVDTGVVTAVAWRIADNTETRKCINTLAVVKLVPDANGDYQIASTQKIQGAASPVYTAVSSDGKTMLVLAEKPLTSGSPAVPSPQVSQGNQAAVTDPDESRPGQEFAFVWTQTLDSVTISAKLPPGARTSDITCLFYRDSVHVSLSGVNPLLPQGKLCGHIVPNDCVWTRQGDVLEVHLDKAPGTGRWVQVFEDDTTPETMDPAELRQAAEALEKFTGDYQSEADTRAGGGSGVAGDFEEVDFEDDARDRVLFHYALPEPGVDTAISLVKKTTLGSRHWLFNAPQHQSAAQYLGVKYNVDTLLYSLSESAVTLEHTATFNALAYVVASKRDKKFITCSGDARVAAVSDCNRQVFVYSQPRNAGAHTADQAIFPFDSPSNILGLQVTKNCVFVLTEEHLYAAHVPTLPIR